MIKAHKLRLHPTPEQANYFARAAGTARFTFNWARAEWQRQYEAGGKPSGSALKKQFNAIRRDQFPWTYETTKCAIEGAFMDVTAAFKNFFNGRKAGRKAGYPTGGLSLLPWKWQTACQKIPIHLLASMSD